MARFTLLTQPNFLELTQGVRADLGKLAGEPAAKKVEEALRPIVQEHYDNLVKQVSFKLRGLGMPAGVGTSGAKGISYGKVGGGVGRFTTRPWAALGERYAKKSPASYKFWHKTGRLSEEFDLSVLSRSYPVFVKEQKASRNHHKNRVNTKFLLGFEPLEFPFEKGVTIPFVRTSDVGPMRDMAKAVDRYGLGRARFAEQSGRGKGRPFLRKLSAYLGRQMRTDITKKLRKL